MSKWTPLLTFSYRLPVGSWDSQENMIFYDLLLSEPTVNSFKSYSQFSAFYRDPVVNARASFNLENNPDYWSCICTLQNIKIKM